MKKVKKMIWINKEAYLFDSRLYIMKSLVAVLTAYALVPQLPLVHNDLISVLFGLMMTLEPVTVTGIRSGAKQITATILGALVTAVIISIFGINIWTVAISVSATLFVCLKINWREVSPVAIFTSIYMTNYVQYTAKGEPSAVLTFELRILALGTGILIAVIFNFLFSLFFYKQMERKRIAHSLNSLTNHMKQLQKAMEECSMSQVFQVKELLPDTFNTIDWLASLMKDKDKETKLIMKLKLPYNPEKTDSYYKVLTAVRNIAHLIYDTSYFLTNHMNSIDKNELQVVSSRIGELAMECDYLANHIGNDFKKYTVQTQNDQLLINDNSRIIDNLNGMKEMLDIINDTIQDIS